LPSACTVLTLLHHALLVAIGPFRVCRVFPFHSAFPQPFVGGLLLSWYLGGCFGSFQSSIEPQICIHFGVVVVFSFFGCASVVFSLALSSSPSRSCLSPLSGYLWFHLWPSTANTSTRAKRRTTGTACVPIFSTRHK